MGRDVDALDPLARDDNCHATLCWALEEWQLPPRQEPPSNVIKLKDNEIGERKPWALADVKFARPLLSAAVNAGIFIMWAAQSNGGRQLALARARSGRLISLLTAIVGTPYVNVIYDPVLDDLQGCCCAALVSGRKILLLLLLLLLPLLFSSSSAILPPPLLLLTDRPPLTGNLYAGKFVGAVAADKSRRRTRRLTLGQRLRLDPQRQRYPRHGNFLGAASTGGGHQLQL